MFNAKKAAYNAAVAAVRTGLATAIALRESLIDEDPSLAGSSTKALQAAYEASFAARTFEGYPGDLPKEENPFRKVRKAFARTA